MPTEQEAAVALRVAASEWADGLKAPVLDHRDSGSLRLDQRLKCAALRYGMAKKRGYTYEFTPKSEKHGRYLLDKIPADLWRRVKQKSKMDGISIRAFILKQLTDWVRNE